MFIVANSFWEALDLLHHPRRLDPYGAAMWSWFTQGNLDTDDGDSFAEGIGQGRVTKNIEGLSVDKAYRVDDQSALSILFHLLRDEESSSASPAASMWPVRFDTRKSMALGKPS